jgi:hypothetical protein
VIRGSIRAIAIAMALVVPLVSGCVTYIPVDEYTIARAAYEAAKDADAARFAPRLWSSAELTYQEAQQSFKDRRYADARSKFVQAKELSEKAEFAARLARQQSGDL